MEWFGNTGNGGHYKRDGGRKIKLYLVTKLQGVEMEGKPEMVCTETGVILRCKLDPGGRLTEVGDVVRRAGISQKRQCLSCGNVVFVAKDGVVGLKRCKVCGVMGVPV